MIKKILLAFAIAPLSFAQQWLEVGNGSSGSSLDVPLNATDASEFPCKTESDAIQKFNLEDPQGRAKAQAIADELRAAYAKKMSDANFLTNIGDYRNGINFQRSDNSDQRDLGRRLIAEAEQLLLEATLIEAVISKIKLSDVAESAIARKYRLRNPLYWSKAQAIANELKVDAAKALKEGEIKTNLEDTRSSVSGRVQDYSRHREEGKRLIAGSKIMSEEATSIVDAIAAIRKSYIKLPDSEAVTGMREWTSRDGKQKITARILCVNGEQLILHRNDDLILCVPKNAFSETDLSFLEEQKCVEPALKDSILTPGG